MNASTSSRTTQVLGAVTLVGLVTLLAYGLVISPPDRFQGETTRIMYVHVPTAIIAFLAFFVTVAGSVGYLVRGTEWWDVVAHASAEIGGILIAATLVTGMLWGAPVWGTYWDWQDARLTTTAVLFLLVLGYLAVRRLPMDRDRRARIAAVVGILLGPTTIICHYATTWWRTLHQGPTISRLDPQIEGTMLFALMVGMSTFLVLYLWLMMHRFRVLWLENRAEDMGLDAAIADRRAEVTRRSPDYPPPAGAGP